MHRGACNHIALTIMHNYIAYNTLNYNALLCASSSAACNIVHRMHCQVINTMKYTHTNQLGSSGSPMNWAPLTCAQVAQFFVIARASHNGAWAGWALSPYERSTLDRCRHWTLVRCTHQIHNLIGPHQIRWKRACMAQYISGKWLK